MTIPLSRSLADAEMAAVVRVEDEFVRSASTARPWSISQYLDRVAAVHLRFTHLRRRQATAVIG